MKIEYQVLILIHILVFAANLAAGYLGIKNKLKPTPEMKKSVFGKDKSMFTKNVEEAVNIV